MSAIDTLLKISENDNLMSYPFRYCLVNECKIPYTYKGEIAHPNKKEDFCSFEDLLNCNKLEEYKGVGISIIESNIAAIDVDKCFSIPFDVNSGDIRAKEILEIFKNIAYIEFSFSGKGLRILFPLTDIENYKDKYYIKNDKTNIEFYLPSMSARYVTLTGRTIYNNPLLKIDNLNIIYNFLDKYMARPKKLCYGQILKSNDINNDLSINELMKKVKSLYLKDIEFQDLWFGEAKGSGSTESQDDYHLLCLLYNNVTTDKDKLQELFEMSPYFSTKDYKHLNKWKYGNYRYYNYMYERLN